MILVSENSVIKYSMKLLLYLKQKQRSSLLSACAMPVHNFRNLNWLRSKTKETLLIEPRLACSCPKDVVSAARRQYECFGD